jgi:hypothetical protein
MKTHELTGPALDWAVAKAEYGLTDVGSFLDGVIAHPNYSKYRPSLNWAQGGPIIERERISICPKTRSAGFKSFVIRPSGEVQFKASGPTPLVAAMRCLVLAELGEEVEVPEKIFSQP